LDLIRDLLDKQLVDRNGHELGRVDSVILEIRDNAPPRLAAIELGPAVLANRVHPFLGRWIAALEHGCGVDQGRPLRIPVGAVLQIRDQVKVDLAFGETSGATVEQTVRRWIGSIPGA
jgi:sporulation protein YlmC with PRC-barrel domain